MLRPQSKCWVGNNLKPVLKKFWGDARFFEIPLYPPLQRGTLHRAIK